MDFYAGLPSPRRSAAAGALSLEFFSSINGMILTFAAEPIMIAASWMRRCLPNNCDRACNATKRCYEELASLRAALEPVLQSQQALRRDYEALVDATRTLSQERDALKQRVAELEAMNQSPGRYAVGTP